MPNLSEYTVLFSWDSEAAVWMATSEDIPGLILESGSFDALVERVKSAAAQLLSINGTISDDTRVLSIRMVSERRELVRL